MKPNDLIEEQLRMKTEEKWLMKKYGNKDCIIGYYECELGKIFIIKGDKTFFAFARYIDLPTYIEFERANINQTAKIISRSGKIIDEVSWKRLEQKLFIEGI